MKNELRPYDEYKKIDLPWLSEIPKTWSLQRAKQLFEVIDERTTTGDEELLSVSANYGVVKRKNTNVTMFKAESYIGYKLCWESDLVVNSLWAWQQGLGFSNYHGIISTAYSVYRLRSEQENYKYYDYLLRSSSYLWELRIRSKGIWRSRYQLHDSSFMDMPFITPPREEQDQIVKYLDYKLAKINKFIKAKKKLIAVLKEQKQAIINQAVTKGLDSNVKMKSSGIEWLGDVPEHWMTKKIKHFSKVNPNTRSVAKQLKDDDCLVFLPMEKISVDGEISCSEKRKYVDVKSGFTSFLRNDVVIAKITPCFENGKGACLKSLETEIGFGTTELIVIRANNEYVDEEYLYYITKTDYFRLFGAEVMTGSAGQKRVPTNYVANFQLAIPGLEEQHSIVESITSKFKVIDESINKIHKELELIQQYRVSLINSVVTGKVDLRSIATDFDNDSDDDDNLDEFLEDNECEDTCGYIDEGGDE